MCFFYCYFFSQDEIDEVFKEWDDTQKELKKRYDETVRICFTDGEVMIRRDDGLWVCPKCGKTRGQVSKTMKSDDEPLCPRCEGGMFTPGGFKCNKCGYPQLRDKTGRD